VSVYRRPNSPFYWCKLYSQGKVFRVSTGERTKKRALIVEREKAAELEAQGKTAGYCSLATVAAKLILQKEADRRRPGTIRKIKEHFANSIIDFFGAGCDVRSITSARLEEYKAARISEVSANTVCKELVTLRQMLRYAHAHKLIREIPTVHNPEIDKQPKWTLLTERQVQRLLSELTKAKQRGGEAVRFFALQANTGMRTGEVGALLWELVDWKQKQITLPAWVCKNKLSRNVPLNTDAIAALRAQGGPKKIGRVFMARTHYESWRAACARAKLSGVRPHDLRHTLGSLLHAAGRPLPEVRDVLGHTSLVTVNHYAHTYQAQLHEAVSKVSLSVPVRVPLLPSNQARSGKVSSKSKKRLPSEKHRVSRT